MATGGGSMGATCRGTRRRIGGASRLCQVARSCSYVLDGLRSWLRDRCSVLGVNRREGPLSEGSDRGKIENGGCASLARVSSRARWAPRSRSLDPRLLRRSRLLESLALAFDRSSLGIANRRSVRGVNYVKRNLSKQEEKGPDKVTVSWQPSEMWSVETCVVHQFVKKKGQSDSEQSPQANHKSQASNEKSFIHNDNIQQREIEKERKNRTFNCKFNNIDSTQTRVHRKPARLIFRVGAGPYKWLEASQRQNGSWFLKILMPDWLYWLRGPAVRPLVHGAKASLVPFGNINCG